MEVQDFYKIYAPAKIVFNEQRMTVMAHMSVKAQVLHTDNPDVEFSAKFIFVGDFNDMDMHDCNLCFASRQMITLVIAKDTFLSAAEQYAEDNDLVYDKAAVLAALNPLHMTTTR